MGHRKLTSRFLKFIYKPWAIFFVSILACSLTLIIERFLGIEWDYHPDANTYITQSSRIFLDLYTNFFITNEQAQGCSTLLCDIKAAKGNLFYVIVGLLNSNINLVIAMNIIVYSVTNSKIASFFRNNCKLESQSYLGILFLLVIFNPYRAHLSVQVLKDTLIIASLVFFTINRSSISLIFYFLMGIFLRNGWIIYLVSIINIRRFSSLKRIKDFFNNKNILLLSASIALVVIYIFWFISNNISTIFHVFINTNGDMTFRGFDNVPSFYELGIFGSIIRAFLWPLLYLSGFFIFFSPSIMYLPIALGSFLLHFWVLAHFKNLSNLTPIYLSIFLSMAILAFIVSGFTSFIRYSLPLLAILPILLINEDKRITEERLIN